jgi:HrpA-like RNA helicase
MMQGKKKVVGATPEPRRGDVLNARGKSLNWLTGLPVSDNYLALAQKWKAMPVYQNKSKLRQIVDSINSCQVTVVVSGTGSGKTTIIPKLALRHMLDTETGGINAGGKKRLVAVTNPKSSITEGNARFAAATLDVAVGGEVGFAFRDAPPDSRSDSTRLLFTTDGYLLAASRRDPAFEDYAVVIVDEAHERTVPIDTLLFMLRRAVLLRPDLRVVVMSATIDPSLFVDYFAETSVASSSETSVRVIGVSGEPYHPVESVFLTAEEDARLDHGDDGPGKGDYLADAGMRALAMALERTGPGEDIIFFVPTAREADRGCQVLRDVCARGLMPANCSALDCSTLYSRLSREKQEAAKALAIETDGYDRKIIFATNIAESSLTLPSLTTVIDSGLELENVYEPQHDAYRMNRVMCTQAQIMQRKGRVGRVQPGTCYHIYSLERMQQQPFYPDPRILTADLTDQLLAMMRDDTFESACRDLSQFITPPTSTQIASSASMLSFYGMMSISVASDEPGRQQQHHDGFRRANGPPGARWRHFHDVDFGAMATDPHLGKSAFTGRITTLGKVALDVMRKTKLGFWNALLILSGLVYGGMEDMVLLAAILEESTGDVASLFTDKGEDAAQSAQRTVVGAARLSVDSEHASLLAVFREASRRKQGGHDQKRRHVGDGRPFLYTGMLNEALVRKIETRALATFDAMRHFEVRSMRAILDDTPLLTVPANGKFSTFQRCIISARLYHSASSSVSDNMAVPQMNKTKWRGGETATYTTLLTLASLRASPEEGERSLLDPSTNGQKKTGFCLYDNAALSKFGSKLKLVSYFEAADIAPLGV